MAWQPARQGFCTTTRTVCWPVIDGGSPALPHLPAMQAKDFHRDLGNLQDQLVEQHAFHMSAEEVSTHRPQCARWGATGVGGAAWGCQPACWVAGAARLPGGGEGGGGGCQAVHASQEGGGGKPSAR